MTATADPPVTLRQTVRQCAEVNGWWCVQTEFTDTFRWPDSRAYVSVSYSGSGEVKWASTPTRYLMGKDKSQHILALLSDRNMLR